MKYKEEIALNFEIDKITNSIENAISGEIFETLVLQITETKKIKKKDWQFDWKSEINDSSRLVYSLTTLTNQDILQGLISISDKGDHIFMNLIESATFNKGKRKLYKGVAGNLIAFACKTSFEKGYNGIVSFVAKTQLIEYYTHSLGAKTFAGNRMFIDTNEAWTLTKNYFKDFSL